MAQSYEKELKRQALTTKKRIAQEQITRDLSQKEPPQRGAAPNMHCLVTITTGDQLQRVSDLVEVKQKLLSA